MLVKERDQLNKPARERSRQELQQRIIAKLRHLEDTRQEVLEHRRKADEALKETRRIRRLYNVERRGAGGADGLFSRRSRAQRRADDAKLKKAAVVARFNRLASDKSALRDNISHEIAMRRLVQAQLSAYQDGSSAFLQRMRQLIAGTFDALDDM